MFGRDDLIGIVAIPAVSTMTAVDLPADALSLLVLTTDELTGAKTYGVPRLAAMLAHREGDARATWVDRDRAPMLAAQQVKHSGWWAGAPTPLLGVTARLDVNGRPVELPQRANILGSHASSLDGTWIVRVTPDQTADLVDRLRHLSRFFKSASIRPDPESGARFVWRPEEDGFEIVVTNPARTQPAASLIGFGGDSSKRGAQLVEDGVAIYLSYEQRDALVTALSTGGAFAVEEPSAGLMAWRLEWAKP
jgi:hypothetical protein